MTAKKLKALPTATQGQRAVAPATRTAGVKARERVNATPPAAEGVDMDVLADKIAARMLSAELASNAVQGQKLGQSSGASFASAASSLQHSTDLVAKASPIDGALSDLQMNLNDLENCLGFLIQAIDPILLYDYDNEKSGEAGMALASISPMHSRILGLTTQVRTLVERVQNTTGRVQL